MQIFITACALLVACVNTATASTAVYDQKWFNSLSTERREDYEGVASDIDRFLKGNDDSREDDHYSGFEPLLLRTAFHSASTFRNDGLGGTNGGTIRHDTELRGGGNGCIDRGVNELKKFAKRNDVTFADVTAIAGAIALEHMDFPAMEHIKIKGGRHDYTEERAHEGKVPNSGTNPIKIFTEHYGMSHKALTALIGGSHNFGAAHPDCSGYRGSWSKEPLSWFGPDGKPDFFTDILRDDWEWFTISNFNDKTYTLERVDKPDFSGRVIGTGARPASKHGAEFDGLKVQAMRGCKVRLGNHRDTDNPCSDGRTGSIRIPSDFFLIEHESLREPAKELARDPDMFAEEFAKAFNHVLHLGIDRCGGRDGRNTCDDDETCKIHDDDKDHGVCIIADEKTQGDDCEGIAEIAEETYSMYQGRHGKDCSSAERVLRETKKDAPKQSPETCREEYLEEVEAIHKAQLKKCKNHSGSSNSKCAKQEERAERYWKRHATLFDWKCRNISKIIKKTLFKTPRDDCTDEFKAHVGKHEQELKDKCESSCGRQLERANRYVERYGWRYFWRCDKREKITSKAYGRKPDNKCDSVYKAHVDYLLESRFEDC